MILAKDFEDFLKLLNNYLVEYMVVGGYALAFEREWITGKRSVAHST
jgi:hypothetical protein